ncbi:MAG: hypothetical protein J5590_02365 [Clostridia bacterium]|nr:hypothetical protein [Clostridia bacterium]
MADKKMYLTNEGYRCYRQSLLLVLIAAINRVFPDAVYEVHQSVNRSTYVEFSNISLHPEDITKIKDMMTNLVDSKFPLTKGTVPKERVSEALKKAGNFELAEKILNTPKETFTYFKDSGKYYGIYAEIVDTAEELTEFELMPFESGFLLRYPHPGYSGSYPPFIWGEKIIKTIDEYRQWNEVTGISNVFDLNREINAGNTREIINIAEIIHEKEISDIAESIKNDANRKVIMIAGPSSSGKTTFANRLMLHLRANGLKPLVISLDDYFLDADKSPRTEDGKPDFETFDSLDSALFRQNLREMAEGKTVLLPKFDFHTSTRSSETREVKLDRSSVVIVEGIHALNERLIEGVPTQYLYRIYCSALTALCFDNVNPISPTDTRLLRRMIRDSRYRNCPAVKTYELWENVTKSEIKTIFPYEHNADVIFNSSTYYEFSFYKPVACELLEDALKVPGEHQVAYKRLYDMLSYFEPVDGKYVPPMSIMREFMGGSSIRYK